MVEIIDEYLKAADIEDQNYYSLAYIYIQEKINKYHKSTDIEEKKYQTVNYADFE